MKALVFILLATTIFS